MRPILLAIGVVAFIGVVASREQRKAGIRETRATLLGVRKALDAYLADNDGACPPSLEGVLDYATFESVPVDAWGRPLRLICPGRREGERYELSSDGPDGKPGGLDRIE
ncbi:MAG TPA: type II secretion system protein GspG [Polyangiaceae bacterium]|nr:type II secretion system protein GspG [Polyangiaceae bacterium]